MVAVFLAVIAMVTQCTLLLVFRHALASLFTDNAAVVAAVDTTLPLVALFNFFDGLQSTMTGGISGTGKQAYSAPIITLAYWVLGLPIGYYLALPLGWGLRGIWLGMLGAATLHAGAYAVLLVCVVDWVEAAKQARMRIRAESAGLSMQFPSGGLESYLDPAHPADADLFIPRDISSGLDSPLLQSATSNSGGGGNDAKTSGKTASRGGVAAGARVTGVFPAPVLRTHGSEAGGSSIGANGGVTSRSSSVYSGDFRTNLTESDKSEENHHAAGFFSEPGGERGISSAKVGGRGSRRRAESSGVGMGSGSRRMGGGGGAEQQR